MKNVIMKSFDNGSGFQNHIFFLDVNYVFNEKSVDDIVSYIMNDPFSDVNIHINDRIFDEFTEIREILATVKYLTNIKKIWLTTDIPFENFSDREDMCYFVDVIDDGMGVMIDFNESVMNCELIEYNNICPF